MMFGSDMMFCIDVIAGTSVDEINTVCLVQFLEWLKCNLEHTYCFATKYLSRAASRQKKNYDFADKVEKKMSEVSYKIRNTPNSKTLVAHKDHLKPRIGTDTPEAWYSP